MRNEVDRNEKVDKRGAEPNFDWSENLHCHRMRVEDWLKGAFNDANCSDEKERVLVVVAVHSHVRLDNYVPMLRSKLGFPRTVIVVVPCCVDQSMEIGGGEAEFSRNCRSGLGKSGRSLFYQQEEEATSCAVKGVP